MMATMFPVATAWEGYAVAGGWALMRAARCMDASRMLEPGRITTRHSIVVSTTLKQGQNNCPASAERQRAPDKACGGERFLSSHRRAGLNKEVHLRMYVVRY